MKKIRNILVPVFLLLFCLTVNSQNADFDGYIVKIKENTSSVLFGNVSTYGATLFSDVSDSYCVELLSDEIETVDILNSDHMLVTVKSKEDLDLLMELGLVEEYEQDIQMQLLGFDYEENSFYSNQKWVYDFINAGFAFDAGITGNGVKVAVIDSGIYPHNDLKDNLLEGYNYCTDMENYDPADTTDNLYHGTFVGGIIAASCNDSGIVGLSHKVKLVPLKVADGMNFNLSKAVEALYDAVDIYDCDVINLSLGSTTDSNTLNTAVNYALNKGALVISAAGNNGNSGYFYPAAYSTVVSVANAKRVYDADDNPYLEINNTSQVNDRVNIAAPGTSVYSLRNNQSGVGNGTGTSYACPVVSAAAALVKSIFPDMNQSEFMIYLKASANNSYITEEQGKNYWGDGLLDVEKLIRTACRYRKLDFYESDLYEYNGESFVYLTNLNDEPVEKCSAVLKSYDENGDVLQMNVFPMSVDAGKTKEFNLNYFGYGQNSSFGFYKDYVSGDADGDGKVTNKDAVKILQLVSGLKVECNEGALDVDSDTIVTKSDALKILQYIAGWNVQLN